MRPPIVHITIDEQGNIQQIHADLRLYEPLTRRHHAPPLQTLLSLKKDAFILPDGSAPQEPFDQYQILWTVTVAPFINPAFLLDYPEPRKIPTFIQLRSCSSPQAAIDLLIEPTTDSSNPQNTEIQIHVIFTDSQNFDHVLLDLYDEPDLRKCITTFIDDKDDHRYINDVSKLVENVIKLRRQFHRFKMKTTQCEIRD
jgi:hypothetical protein